MRVHLSYSVVTWRKELDLSFKPKLDVELTIFTNPWAWIWGLTLNETWVLWGHSQSSLKDKGAASQCFKTGLGRRPWLSKATPRTARRTVSASSSLMQRSDPKFEAEGPTPWVSSSLLPLAHVELRLWPLPHCPFYFLWDSSCFQLRHFQLPPTMCNFLFTFLGQRTHQVFSY